MDVFAITPASTKPLWFITIICLLLALVFIALAYTAYSSQRSQVEVDHEGIRLVGDFWGRRIPFSMLNTADARILDLGKHEEHALKRRTFGTGLPGYASGWFRLRNGEKALVYLSRRTDIAYLPTTDGYSLLLSVDDPQRFIDVLRQYTR